jgi:hypothetical protein
MIRKRKKPKRKKLKKSHMMILHFIPHHINLGPHISMS